jgi:hypothetical protein
MRGFVTMRRLFASTVVVVMLLVVSVGSAAKGQSNWNCRDISVKLSSKSKVGRTVCYPCNPELLLEGTPDLIVLLWQQEVCAPA